MSKLTLSQKRALRKAFPGIEIVEHAHGSDLRRGEILIQCSAGKVGGMLCRDSGRPYHFHTAEGDALRQEIGRIAGLEVPPIDVPYHDNQATWIERWEPRAE